MPPKAAERFTVTPPEVMLPILVAAVSGVLWGTLAMLTVTGGPENVEAEAWTYSLVAGPLIGVAVYLISRERYARPEGAGFKWSLFTVVLAGLLYMVPAVLLSGESVGTVLSILGAGALWTVLFPPLWLLVGTLAMLAYANHSVMRQVCGHPDPIDHPGAV